MKVEVYTKLGEAVRLFKNKANTADCILLFHDRESELSSVDIHICKNDLLELSKTIQKWLVSQERKDEK